MHYTKKNGEMIPLYLPKYVDKVLEMFELLLALLICRIKILALPYDLSSMTRGVETLPDQVEAITLALFRLSQTVEKTIDR